MTEEKSSLGSEDSEVFEAISHPLRIKILNNIYCKTFKLRINFYNVEVSCW
jgi:hypothetical protein